MPTQRTTLFELLLTILVTLFLMWVAQPLTELEAAVGMGHRYTSGIFTDPAAKTNQAFDLALELPMRLVWLACGGWLALRLSRLPLPRVAAMSLIGATWAAIWGIQFAPLASPFWLLGSAALCALALFTSLRAGTCQPAPPAVNAIAYPGWVLFTGLGLIWLVDYSARAYLKWQFLALYHIESLFIAYVVLTLAATGGSAVVGVLARVCAAIDKAAKPVTAPAPAFAQAQTQAQLPNRRAWLQRFSPFLIPLALALWALLVVALFGRHRPGLTSELLRLPFYAVGGWLVYRWSGQNTQGRLWAGSVLAVFAVGLGLVGTGDFGQVLLLGLAVAVASGAAVAFALGGNRLAVLLGALAAACVMALGLQLVSHFGHTVSAHIGQRAFALENPFAGPLDYLSELRWFAASTPPGGHGLVNTPWCGTLAHLGELVRCAGVPKEMHSDYVFAGLAGIWGAWTALAITLCLDLWLLSMVRLPSTLNPGDPQRLRLAIFACFVAITLAQLFFTALGSLGQVVLTGITFPFMAFGGASLVASAALVGLGLPAAKTAKLAARDGF